MIEFGKTLRTARESKGLTTAQVAESTHMMIQTVEGLEREDFSKIVAPIYGRGFVKLYCETVGIDHRPLVDAFMEMYNNRHAGTPAVAPKPESIPSDPAPQPSTAPVPQPAASEPPRVQELDFSAIRSAAPQQMHEPSPFSTSPRPPAAPAPSRYAAPMPIDDGPSFSIPTINWRLVALVAAAAALLALASLGIRAIDGMSGAPCFDLFGRLTGMVCYSYLGAGDPCDLDLKIDGLLSLIGD